MVEMEVAGIALEAVNKVPIVILRDLAERRAIPILVGKAEASAILKALESEEPARPMTHDLILSSWTEWGIEVERIVICALKDDTFYALITTVRDGEKKEIDSRPSDAIAIALRADAPIWAMEEVISEASIPIDRDADAAEQEEFREFLRDISPKDFISGNSEA
ncbi:MAG: bifunctional nuclease family protein [Cyanobacteria bacterium J06639_1]